MIKIYGTKGCPMCSMVKSRLEKLNVPFEYVSDVDEMLKLGIQHVPTMQDNDGWHDTKEILRILAEMEAEKNG